MPAILLVKKQPTRWPTGSVVGVYPDGHIFGRLESYDVFRAQSPDEEWPKQYVRVKILDKGPDDPEIANLAAQDGGSRLPTQKLRNQTTASPYYLPLLLDAYVEVPWSVAQNEIEAI